MSPVKTAISYFLVATIAASSMLQGNMAVEIVQLIEAPQSQNTSEGRIIEFSCVFPSEQNYTDFFLTMTPPAGPSATSSKLPNDDIRHSITVVASVEHNGAIISCFAQRDNITIHPNQSNNAVLGVQGRLSSVNDLDYNNINCSLYITWTAPYTLQGVPINYYTINISDGAVVWSDTTNTTEYLYSVSSSQLLGETLEVVVAAVNGAGIGNVSNITIPATCVKIVSSTVDDHDQPTANLTSTTSTSTPEVTSILIPKDDNTLAWVLGTFGVIIIITAAIILPMVLVKVIKVHRKNKKYLTGNMEGRTDSIAKQETKL